MLIFCTKNYGTGWVGGWVDGWMNGWVDGRAGLRIAYSKSKIYMCVCVYQVYIYLCILR